MEQSHPSSTGLLMPCLFCEEEKFMYDSIRLYCILLHTQILVSNKSLFHFISLALLDTSVSSVIKQGV